MSCLIFSSKKIRHRDPESALVPYTFKVVAIFAQDQKTYEELSTADREKGWRMRTYWKL